jgi:TonB family protein
MNRTFLLRVLLALATGVAVAQQELPPATDAGPLVVRPAAKPQAAMQAPAKDRSRAEPVDGTSNAGPALVLPRMLTVPRILYPGGAPATGVPRVCVLSLIVGVDGSPSEIEVLRSIDDLADGLLVDEARKMRFEPGTLAGAPVPVRIHLSFRFSPDTNIASPRIVSRRIAVVGSSRRTYDKPPIAVQIIDPEYSMDARRNKIQGVVLVSVMVTEDGLPADLRVERPLGYGLDEAALTAVSKYRFTPAMKDGQPVAARIFVEVNFRLY